MTDTTMFKEAIEALRQGENDRALDLFSRLLRTDKDNPEYWLWMSSVVNSTKEQKFCLKNVLRLDPDNAAARRGLILLGELPSDQVNPLPFQRRSWEAEIGKNLEELRGFRRLMANPVLRVLIFVGGSIVLTGLILAGIFGTRGIFRPRLTITPIAWSPTPTQTPTPTPRVRTSTPTPVFTATPEPLWKLLEATYTPIPLYVSTPHPRLEAYRLAMRAYERADYQNMITFLEQTIREEEESPDLTYYLGEAYRLTGDFEQALEFYGESLSIDPNFAPAYLSSGLVRYRINPQYDVMVDFEKALERDPVYGEVYFQRALYYKREMDYEAALKDLNEAVRLMPYDFRLFVELAEVYLEIGDAENALDNAAKAYERDITNLQVYLVLAKAYLANDMFDEALEKIEVYGLYKPNDPQYLALQGGILFEIGEDYQNALELLERAQQLDPDLDLAHYYHGRVSIVEEDPKQAVNDLYIARSLVPRKFDYNIWFGIALYENERFEDAYGQINASESLIMFDDQRAIFLYYKAKAGHELAQFGPVREAYQALLELPENIVPDEWISEAENYLAPPTSTSTPTLTATITPTTTNTSTSTITIPPNKTQTSTNTPSPTPTKFTTRTPNP
jgi:tetratricopeptide (TPR) repeat protein